MSHCAHAQVLPKKRKKVQRRVTLWAYTVSQKREKKTQIRAVFLKEKKMQIQAKKEI